MNIEKALLPGMWSLMRAGGYGSARMSFPCLLPLLSRLVDKVCNRNVEVNRNVGTYCTTVVVGHPVYLPRISAIKFSALKM